MQRLYDSFKNEVSNTIFWHELFRVLYDIKRIYVVQRTHTTLHVLDLKLDLKNKRFKSKKRRSIKWTEAWSSIDYITGRDNFCVYVERFSIIFFHRICYNGCYSCLNIFSFLEKSRYWGAYFVVCTLLKMAINGIYWTMHLCNLHFLNFLSDISKYNEPRQCTNITSTRFF